MPLIGTFGNAFTKYRTDYMQIIGAKASNPITDQVIQLVHPKQSPRGASKFFAHDFFAHSGSGLAFPLTESFEIPAGLSELAYIGAVLGKHFTPIELKNFQRWVVEASERITKQPFQSDVYPDDILPAVYGFFEKRAEQLIEVNPEFRRYIEGLIETNYSSLSYLDRKLSKFLGPNKEGQANYSKILEREFADMTRRPLVYRILGKGIPEIKVVPESFSDRQASILELEKTYGGWKPKDPNYYCWRNCMMDSFSRIENDRKLAGFIEA